MEHPILTTAPPGGHGAPASMESELMGLQLLIESVYERSGIDFREYAFSSLKRRVRRRLVEEGVGSISELRDRVLGAPESMERLLAALTTQVTALYRDPLFYSAFRERVVPALRTYPFLRLWVAGCSTGEEVYSLAILLHEEGLHSRCRIYATDVSEAALAKARAGIFPLSLMQEYTRNYQKAGGAGSLADYYTADSEAVIFRPFLRESVLFATHNLAGDASFNEFHVILCRNVMIYFNRRLQDRVHRLFSDSLIRQGFLGLGRSESISFSSCRGDYETVSARERIYRKIR